MREDDDKWDGKDRKPIPDPTALTTEQLNREIAALAQTAEERNRELTAKDREIAALARAAEERSRDLVAKDCEIAAIARAAEERSGGLRVHFAELAGTHPLAIDALARGLAAALGCPPHPAIL